MSDQQAGATPEAPLYFRWVRDDDGQVNWARVILMLGLTALSAYLSVQAQRAGSSPDVNRTLAMGLAQKRITAGVRIRRFGERLEESGWRAYERVRS